jgi:predicted dehydrogenase
MNLAVVGCGAVANEHLRVLKYLDAVDAIAVCDIDEKAATRAANEWRIDRCYTDFSKMLDHEKLSIVSILTPPQYHAALAIEAIEHHVNVLVEKPLTMSTSEAESVLNSLMRNPVKLTVNYNWLMTRAMRQAISQVNTQVIGDPLGTDIKLLHTKNDPMASDEKHWCHRLIGGRFGELLAHPVYLLQAILGNNLNVMKVLPEKRGSLRWMPYDELYVTLRSNTGVGQIYVSFNAPRPGIFIDIYGTRRILRVDLLNQNLISLGHRTVNKIDSAMDSLTVSGKLLFSTIGNTLEYFYRERGQNALQSTYRSLVDSILNDSEPAVTPQTAYHTVRIVEEICRGIR